MKTKLWFAKHFFLSLLVLAAAFFLLINPNGKPLLAQINPSLRHWTQADLLPDHLINTFDMVTGFKQSLSPARIKSFLGFYGCPRAPRCQPSLNPIDWQTSRAFLKADDFYMNINGQTYYSTTDDFTLSTIESNPTLMGLQATWQENGRTMRLVIHFINNGQNWWSPVVLTYDGAIQPNWLYYQKGQPFFTTPLGQKFTGSITLESEGVESGYGGRIYFTNLELQAFLDSL